MGKFKANKYALIINNLMKIMNNLFIDKKKTVENSFEFLCVQCLNQRGKKRVVVNIGFCFYLTIMDWAIVIPTAGRLSIHLSTVITKFYVSIDWLTGWLAD